MAAAFSPSRLAFLLGLLLVTVSLLDGWDFVELQVLLTA